MKPDKARVESAGSKEQALKTKRLGEQFDAPPAGGRFIKDHRLWPA